MKDILIINLTRMGDLIQTTPAIRGLKNQFPDVRITLLVSSAFSEVCQLIPHIDRLIIFDVKGLVEALGKGPCHLVEGFRYIEEILTQVNETRYDLAINYTHSTDSAILSSLIHAAEIRGHCIDEEGYSVKKHPWIRYFFNVIPGREYNPFHLCDMHLKAAGLVPDGKGLELNVSDDVEDHISALLDEYGAGNNYPLIAFQLGASAEDKRWSVRSFALLADRLAEAFNARIVLTGSGGEAGLGKEFEKAARIPPLNLIGKTNLKELAALIKRCSLLISNDTGTLHVATAVGTKTINISLASVHFRETGPYGEGHYVIAPEIPCSPCSFHSDCRDAICKEVVSPDHIFELAAAAIRNEMVKSIDDSSLWKNVQVYESFFDNDGLLNYRPMIKRPLKKEMFFNHIYRKTWLSILDNKDIGDVEMLCQAVDRRFHEWYVYDSFMSQDLVQDEFNELIKLKNLIEIALTKVSNIASEARKLSPDMEWIKISWETMPVIEQEMDVLGRIYPPLKPLTVVFRYGKESLEGRDLLSMAEETVRLYSELKNHASLMIQLVEKFKTAVPLAHCEETM